jgi:hypothetical protein
MVNEKILNKLDDLSFEELVQVNGGIDFVELGAATAAGAVTGAMAGAMVGGIGAGPGAAAGALIGAAGDLTFQLVTEIGESVTDSGSGDSK